MSQHRDSIRYLLGLSAALIVAPLAVQPAALAQANGSTYDAALQLSPEEGDGSEAPLDLLGPGEEPAETGATYARLLHYEGGISLRRPADLGAPDAVVSVNSPLVPGDEIYTGADGRVEIQLADGSFLRLDTDSRLSMLNLADLNGSFDTTTLLRLPNGSLYIHATNFDARERRFQVDTPAGSIFLLSEGIFRVDVRGSGTTSVASYRGVAEILSDQTSVVVHSGERLSAAPGRPPGEARAFNTLRRDDFDLWADARDDAIASARSARGPDPVQVPAPVRPYVSELSAYGTWHDTPEYGLVWIPERDDPDWRPYHYGSWVWAPIGVVWVSSEPWGYAPYHYGRWHWTAGLGWFWAPGYVYSGAYVQWAVGPSWYGWCPVGFYGSPVIYAGHHGHHYHWSFVHHRHFYRHHVHRHVYGYSDVVRHRLHDRSHYLRSHPRAHPRHRPEHVGRATYKRASRGDGVLPRDTARASRKVPFRDRERRQFTRRAAGRDHGAVARGGNPRGRSLREPGSASSRSGGSKALRPRSSQGQAVSRPSFRAPLTRQAPLTRAGDSRGRVKAPSGRVSPVSGKRMGKPVARSPRPADGYVPKPVVRRSRPSGDDRGVVSRMGRSRYRPPSPQSRQIRQRTRPRSSNDEQGVIRGRERGSSMQPHSRVSPRRSTRSSSPFVMVPRDRGGKDGAKMKPRSRRGPSKSTTMKRSRSSSGSKAKPAPRRGKRSGGKGKGGKKK